MAEAEISKLIVSLEARVRGYEKALAKAQEETRKRMQGIDDQVKRPKKSIEGLGRAMDAAAGRMMGAAGRIGGALAAAFSVREVGRAASAFVNMTNTLKVAGLEGEALQKTFGQLYRVAQENGVAIEPLVTLYSRLSQSKAELNATDAQLIKFTNGVSLALKVAGTDANAASGALLQLGQALGGSVVRAEEFNSINEGARPILSAVAAGLEEAGGSVSKLRALVLEGKVSSEAFFNAFLAGMPMLAAQSAKAEGTVSASMNRVGNAFVALVGHLDQTYDASKNAASGLDAVAGVIEGLPAYIDAAVAGLQSLDQWLASVGNSDVWRRVGEFLGVDYSDEGLRRAGLDTARPPTLPKVNRDGTTNSTRFDDAFAIPPDPALAQALAKRQGVNPVSLRNFKVEGDKKGASAGKKAKRDEFERELEAIRARTESLEIEADTIGRSTFESAKYKATQDLLNAARDAGVKIGEKERATIDEVAIAYANAAVRVEDLETSYAQAQEAAQAFGDLALGAISDLAIEGESFEAVLQNLAKALARMALQAALLGQGPLAGLFGGAGGGLFGAIGKGLGLPGFARGGYVSGPGTATSDSIPARLSKGEFVVNAAATRQNLALLQAINAGRATQMLAAGGMVGMSRSVAGLDSGGGVKIDMKITNNAPGVEAVPGVDATGSPTLLIRQIEGGLAKRVGTRQSAIGRAANAPLRG